MAETPTPLPLDTPADGIPEVVDSERGVDACAAAIRRGTGSVWLTGVIGFG